MVSTSFSLLLIIGGISPKILSSKDTGIYPDDFVEEDESDYSDDFEESDDDDSDLNDTLSLEDEVIWTIYQK